MTKQGMTCYARDEELCEDQMCLRLGCRISNKRHHDGLVREIAGAICCKAHKLGCAAQHKDSEFTVCQISTFMRDAENAVEVMATYTGETENQPVESNPPSFDGTTYGDPEMVTYPSAQAKP